jgi:hypothetical protein
MFLILTNLRLIFCGSHMFLMSDPLFHVLQIMLRVYNCYTFVYILCICMCV